MSKVSLKSVWPCARPAMRNIAPSRMGKRYFMALVKQVRCHPTISRADHEGKELALPRDERWG